MDIQTRLRQPKTLMWVAIAIAAFAVIYVYILYNKYYPSTDNAYVGANVINIAPQVTGPILKLYVQNFETVKKGQPLFDIDPAPFQVAVNRAEAQLDLAKQNVEALRDSVKTAEALVQQREHNLQLAKKTYDRIMQLVKLRQISLADGDKATRDFSVATAELLEVKNQLEKAKAELGDDDGGNAGVRSAEAELTQAKLNLEYTHVVSPADGYVVNLTARVGSMLQSGTSYFSIVDLSQWWVDANYKETELARIRPGQLADIVVDIYPDHTFHGRVESISRGSGSAFSIFPAENATGNWVKVTQRFSVRIKILDPDPAYPLRIGASATVQVNTTGHK